MPRGPHQMRLAAHIAPKYILPRGPTILNPALDVSVYVVRVVTGAWLTYRHRLAYAPITSVRFTDVSIFVHVVTGAWLTYRRRLAYAPITGVRFTGVAIFVYVVTGAWLTYRRRLAYAPITGARFMDVSVFVLCCGNQICVTIFYTSPR